jgi:hypothetical protein
MIKLTNFKCLSHHPNRTSVALFKWCCARNRRARRVNSAHRALVCKPLANGASSGYPALGTGLVRSCIHYRLVRHAENEFAAGPKAILRVVTAILFVAAQIINRLPVFQRDIVAVLQDPNVAHPHKSAQYAPCHRMYVTLRLTYWFYRVPGWLNVVFSFYFPLFVAILNGLVRVNSHELHHGVLACLSGWCASVMATPSAQEY